MTTRDYQIDTIKGILIFLVVLGHSFSYALFKSSEMVFNLYMGVYLFHMPLFIFIGGYFSKRHNEKRIIELFLVYAIWQMIINPLFMHFILDESLETAINPLFSPHKSYWYLLSFVFWRIITPYASKLKYILPVSIIIGLLIGFTEVRSLATFSYSRTVAFYPFFIAGYLLTPSQLNKFKSKFNKYMGILCFGIIILLGVTFIQSLSDEINKITNLDELILYRTRYSSIFIDPLIGPIIRLILYAISFTLVFLPFTFISSKQNIFVKWGQNSLFIYLSHILILEVLDKIFAINTSTFNPFILIGASCLFSLFYCWFTSLTPITHIGKRLTTVNITPFIKQLDT